MNWCLKCVLKIRDISFIKLYTIKFAISLTLHIFLKVEGENRKSLIGRHIMGAFLSWLLLKFQCNVPWGCSNPRFCKMCFYNNALDKYAYAYAYISKAWCIFFIHFTIVMSSFFLVLVFSPFSLFISFFIIIFTIFTIHDTFQSTLLLSDTTNFIAYVL